MAHETEIKLRIKDKAALLRRLKKLHARTVATGSGRIHEMNVIFDTPAGDLGKHGQLLRIRTETPDLSGKPSARRMPAKLPKQRILLTMKLPVATDATSRPPKPGPRHKVREELELQVADAGTLTHIFEGLGMKGWFRYEKYRTTFRLPAAAGWAKSLLIELDETPIGIFVELEGPPEAIDRAAGELGFAKRDYVVENYLSLYVKACRASGQEPRDMLFDLPK
jgi:adenylate cyclase class 2